MCYLGVTHMWEQSKLQVISIHTITLPLRKLHRSSFKGKPGFWQECNLTTKTWGGLEPRYIFFGNTNMNLFFLISVHYHHLYKIIKLYHNQVHYQKVFPKNQFKFQLTIRVFFKQNQKFNTEWNMYCNMHLIHYTYYRFHLLLIWQMYERVWEC